MPKLIFTQEEIDNYLKEKTFNVFYEKAKCICDDMCVHADGLFPHKLLYERRPNEPLEVMEYRKKIFTANTKSTFTKIFSSLQKIRRSSDWSIRFEGQFTRITEGETLEDYTEYNYPSFTSLTNWVFTLMLRKYLIDPNAVVYVAPMTTNVLENEYLQPIAQVFDSRYVIDFVEDDYAVLLQPTGCMYYSGNKPVKGKRYLICTTQQTLTYDQVNGRGGFALTSTYDHGLGTLPAFKLKGLIIDQMDNQFLYESKIGGIIPELDEAIREYSDLQAAKVLHIYPERWEVTQSECISCKGTGLRQNPAFTGPGCGCEAQIQCNGCDGRGYKVAGPYSKILVKPAGMGEQQIPTPPAGYVEKDVEIVKVMDGSVDAHIYKALSAINFEFLAEKPLATSGIKTAMDGDELNNTVHGIAEDIVAAMDNIYWLIALYRYKTLYSETDIIEMVPEVAVPEKFDILSSTHLLDQLKEAKNSKFNPVLLSALETYYAATVFNTDPTIRDTVHLILTLDPMPNITEDDKMTRLSNKGVTLETYVISSNIQEFVQRAVADEKNFVDMSLDDQKGIMSTYAQEVIAANETTIKPIDMGIAQAQPFAPGDKVMVKPGMEHRPQHKGMQFTVDSVNGNAYTLQQPDGLKYDGYVYNQLIAADNAMMNRFGGNNSTMAA